MNKKLIKLLIFEIAAIAAIIYFTQTSWNTTRSTSGHLSKETYLNGGTGTEEIKKDYRLYYECVIGSGTMCIEIRDEDDNIVKRKVISETENGYILQCGCGLQKPHIQHQMPILHFYHLYTQQYNRHSDQ